VFSIASMGRSKSVRVDGADAGVNAKAVYGTNTVVLAWDLPLDSERQGLAGFAIEKIHGSHREWLPGGGRHFKEVEDNLHALTTVEGTAEVDDKAGDARRLTTCEAPIQGFSWCDYTCKPGEELEYRICPVYFSTIKGPLQVQQEKGAALRVHMESNTSFQHHEVWFNRGVAGSQDYRRRFGSLPPQEAGPEAWTWLSNGLSEALLAFIGRALGPGWSLRCAFYEFTWKPALEALQAAAERGVDVSIVVDCGSSAPRDVLPPDASQQGPSSGRVDLKVSYSQKDDAKRLGARWDPESKVWFAPNAEVELVQRWGPHVSPLKNGPLKADMAIDQVPGLRKLVIRRENCKAISHNKFMVLSQPHTQLASVWTGSTNITESGIFGQANVAHIVNSSHIAEQYLEYWGRLAADVPTTELTQWNASQKAEDALPIPGKSVAPSIEQSVCVVTCPRPSLQLLDSYAAFLASAQTCACLTFAFSIDKGLASILEEDSGVSRYLLLEKRSKAHESLLKVGANRIATGAVLGEEELHSAVAADGSEFWEAERLTGLNEHVHYVHTKFMLLDPLGQSPTTISGSANFSKASVQKNDENMLFITGDTRVSDLYFVEFWRLFQHWQFRDRVSQRMWDRRSAKKEGSELPPQFKLHLVDNDSWTERFYDPDHAKCRDRSMLMAMFVPEDAERVKMLQTPAAAAQRVGEVVEKGQCCLG